MTTSQTYLWHHSYSCLHSTTKITYAQQLACKKVVITFMGYILIYQSLSLSLYIYIYIKVKKHLLSLFNNISEYFDSFVRLTENLKLYNYMKLPNKNYQRTKEKSIKILSNGPIYN